MLRMFITEVNIGSNMIPHKQTQLPCLFHVLFSSPKKWLQVAQKRMCKTFFSKRTPPLPLHAQSEHNAPPPWLSVLFLLEKREKEQGYTGRHINGACHAR